MNKQLSSNELQTITTIVNFAKHFAVDILRVSNTHGIVGIDSVPSIAIFIEPKVQYSGPEFFLNRLKVLSQRLTGASSAIISYNSVGYPFNLTIQSPRSTVDFRLANLQQGKRLPAAFKGSFAHSISCTREHFTEGLAGATAVGAKTVQLIRRDNELLLSASNEGETFTYLLGKVPGAQFTFNYSIEHLYTVEKLLSKETTEVVGEITPKGQLMINIEAKDLTAQVFILDIKNR